MKVRFTEQQLADAFAEMPNGTSGFLKEWGYVTYARALERIVNEPEMITIGRRTVVGPLREADGGDDVAIVDFCGVDDIVFDSIRHSQYLRLGLIYSTREQAQAALDAILEMLAPLPQQDRIPA